MDISFHDVYAEERYLTGVPALMLTNFCESLSRRECALISGGD
jgi:hypothetical protein